MLRKLLNFWPKNSGTVFAVTCNQLQSKKQCTQHFPPKVNTEILDVSSDGSLQYQYLTREYLNDSLAVMREDFFPHENICKALGIQNDPNCIEELLCLCSEVGKDGVTVIAVDKATNKVAGTAFNKLRTNLPLEDDHIFDNFAQTCKHKGSKTLMEYFSEMDKQFNYFDFCKVDSLMELMFIATRSEYKRRGIGIKMSEVSMQLAEKLNKGINVRRSIDNTELKLGPVPKIVSVIATMDISQEMNRKMGFLLAAEFSYNDIVWNGRKFGDYIDKNTPKMRYSYKRLD